jgi:hypothetical protein
LKKEDVFRHVVTNAFDFLEKSLNEFETNNYKYSVINFCAAVELFLKARLIVEHWTLILSRNEELNLTAFLAGDFNSAGLHEIKNRLEKVARDGLSEQASKAFQILTNHRNKAIHFCHPGLISQEDAAGIVREQCRAWYYLHDLLTNRWREIFLPFVSDIERISLKMRTHRKFFEEKYSALKEQINRDEQAGFYFHKCPTCEFLSMKFSPESDNLFKVECLVCDQKDIAVQINCPQCKELVTFIGEGLSKCACGKWLEDKDLFKVLFNQAEADYRYKDGDTSYREGNCCVCGGMGTVIPYNDEYFCLNCFGFFPEMFWCGWCGEPQTDDTEDSYLCGCHFCDGKLGDIKDD